VDQIEIGYDSRNNKCTPAFLEEVSNNIIKVNESDPVQLLLKNIKNLNNVDHDVMMFKYKKSVLREVSKDNVENSVLSLNEKFHIDSNILGNKIVSMKDFRNVVMSSDILEKTMEDFFSNELNELSSLNNVKEQNSNDIKRLMNLYKYSENMNKRLIGNQLNSNLKIVLKDFKYKEKEVDFRKMSGYRTMSGNVFSNSIFITNHSELEIFCFSIIRRFIRKHIR